MKQPTHQSLDELDVALHSFIQMRFKTCKHSLLYFKSKDIFEYNLIPNIRHTPTHSSSDLKNLGRYINKIQYEYECIYKDIYRITTYIHRKRGYDVYKVELI